MIDDGVSGEMMLSRQIVYAWVLAPSGEESPEIIDPHVDRR